MIVVLDACAVLALLTGEVGHDVVEAAIADHTCYIHAITLAEVYRIVARDRGVLVADELGADIRAQGIEVRTDFDDPFWQDAAGLALIARCAFADFFVMALARRLGATVLTCDHHEYQAHAAAGTCAIHFFRTPGPRVAATAVPLP